MKVYLAPGARWAVVKATNPAVENQLKTSFSLAESQIKDLQLPATHTWAIGFDLVKRTTREINSALKQIGMKVENPEILFTIPPLVRLEVYPTDKKTRRALLNSEREEIYGDLILMFAPLTVNWAKEVSENEKPKK